MQTPGARAGTGLGGQVHGLRCLGLSRCPEPMWWVTEGCWEPGTQPGAISLLLEGPPSPFLSGLDCDHQTTALLLWNSALYFLFICLLLLFFTESWTLLITTAYHGSVLLQVRFFENIASLYKYNNSYYTGSTYYNQKPCFKAPSYNKIFYIIISSGSYDNIMGDRGPENLITCPWWHEW